MDKINIYEKLNLFNEYWSPKILGEVNESYVKVANLKGEFLWHIHHDEDEMFDSSLFPLFQLFNIF